MTMLLALSLVASSLEAVVLPKVASASPRPVKRDPREMPLLHTPSGPERAFAPAKPNADFRPLMGAGKGGQHAGTKFDSKTSKEVGRSEKSVEYINADGSRSVRLSQVPVSVQDERGVWQPVDTRLWEDAGSTKAKAGRDGLQPEFAAHADDAALVSVNQGGTPVSIAVQGARPAPRKIKDSTATYADVLPDTDLEYVVEPGGVKESIIVKKAPAAGAGSWVFRMDLGALTPSSADGGVVITDGKGAVVAALPPVQAWDSSGSETDHYHRAPAQTGGTYTLKRDGNAWLVTVSVDQKWLTDPARVFPVVVDPTYTSGYSGGAESYAYKSDGTTCHNCNLQVGNSVSGPQGNPNTYWRTALRFDYTALFGTTVVGARLDFSRWASPNGSPLSWNSNLYQATSPLGYNALGQWLAWAPIGDWGSMWSDGLTSFIAGRVAASDNNAWMMLTGDEGNSWSYKYMQVSLVVDYGNPPPATSIVAPADNSVLTGLTPTLSVNAVTNPSGDATSYCFKVSTRADGLSGVVVDSGCQTSTSWTVPAGVLQDGMAYTWRVLTSDPSGTAITTPSWVGHFKVDQRIGASGPSPTDEPGPVSVNLANGNVSLRDAGPTFVTVGGTAGLTFSYNSQQPNYAGLQASYFADLAHNGSIPAGQNPVLVRTESQVNADWGTTSPFPPVLPADWYVVRWEGYFQVPVTGTYQFAGVHANGANIWVNGTQVYTQANASDVNWSLASAGGSGTPIALTGGARVPIKVELHHSSGAGRMRLFVETSDGTTVPPQVVPPSWLFTADSPTLSQGWTLSANLDGPGNAYAKAAVVDQTVVLTDAMGTKHTWTKQSDGGYAPPLDEQGVLTLDTNGAVTLLEGGIVYVFNVDGTLAAQTSDVDSRKPAMLQNIYSGTPSRLTQIKDPVSGRAHTLYYNTDGTNGCYGGATAPPGADATAPLQMLCRIAYWDGSETRVWYSGQALSRIENPGQDVQDYQYSSTTGPLTALRDSLAVDWVAVDPANRDLATTKTQIAYDTSTPPKATSVTLPAPDGGASTPRPAHSYRYDPANSQTFVDVAGLSPAVGYASKVTYDGSYRPLTLTDATGKTRSETWNVKDQPLTKTDSAGRVSTTVYDYADRPTDNYGPAPASCFNGQVPTSACASTVPHTHTNYDENVVGLSMTYYDNMTLSGAPKVYATGVGTPDGSLNKNWGSNAPTTGPITGYVGKCVDVRGGSSTNGTPVQIYTCNGTNAQQWSVNTNGTLTVLGKCMDITGGGTSNGTKVQIYDCNGSGAQQWISTNGQLVNPQSGRCLDDTNWSTTDATQLQIWDCTGNANQKWTPSPTGTPWTQWSLRANGDITFPQSGSYVLKALSDDGVRVWVDDTLVIDNWHNQAATWSQGTYTSPAAGATKRIRVEYYQNGGNSQLELDWVPPGGAQQVVPGQYLHPRYGLTTSTVVSESNGVPDGVTATKYTDNGLDAVYALGTSTSAAPAGLNLTGQAGYETPGVGYLRETSATMPSGSQYSYAYYGDTETRANPCVTGSPLANQAGMPKLTTSPTPATGGARTQEQVYDASGRVVAGATSGDWICTTYDARDRVTQVTFPANATAGSRTVTNNYAVGGDPLTTSVSDTAGTVTTKVNLVGQLVSYTDVQGTVTTNTYNQAGRLTQQVLTPPNALDAAQTSTFTYDDAGRPLTEKLGATTLATATYDANGEPASVAYGNGSSLAAIGKNSAGALTSLTWQTSDSIQITSGVDRTRAGIIYNDWESGSNHPTGGNDFAYDTAGRLTDAYLKGHHFTYDYTSTANPACPTGTQANAGTNSNRMRLVDQIGTNTSTTSYCYDAADRLIATTGATTLTGITYDTHGNTTSFTNGATTTNLGFDTADRHLTASTTSTDPTQVASITYTRDATDRLVRRDATAGDTQATVLYGYTEDGDSADLTMDGTKRLLSRSISLPGGVLLTYTYPGGTPTPEYDHVTVRGDIFFSTDGTGRQSGGTFANDPFGEPMRTDGTIDPQAVPANQPGKMNYGWLGQNQRPYEHAGGLSLVEMGARPYSPLLGRFLSVDPVEGGNANDYIYPDDPINQTDLTGEDTFKAVFGTFGMRAVHIITANIAMTLCDSVHCKMLATGWIFAGFNLMNVLLGSKFCWVCISPGAGLNGIVLEFATGMLWGAASHVVNDHRDVFRGGAARMAASAVAIYHKYVRGPRIGTQPYGPLYNHPNAHLEFRRRTGGSYYTQGKAFGGQGVRHSTERVHCVPGRFC